MHPLKTSDDSHTVWTENRGQVTNPLPAANHGLAEWNALQPLIARDTILVVDDTPRSVAEVPWLPLEQVEAVSRFCREYSLPPGEGTHIFREISRSADWEILHHTYNLVAKRLT